MDVGVTVSDLGIPHLLTLSVSNAHLRLNTSTTPSDVRDGIARGFHIGGTVTLTVVGLDLATVTASIDYEPDAAYASATSCSMKKPMPTPSTSTCQWSPERCRGSRGMIRSGSGEVPRSNSSSSTRVARGATTEKFTPWVVTLAPRGQGCPSRIDAKGPCGWLPQARPMTRIK